MGKQMSRRIWRRILRGSCLLASFWVLIGISNIACAGKPVKPPKDDGDSINYQLARISLGDSSRIKWDGVAVCEDFTRPGDPVWDYWDQFDTTLTEQNPVYPEEGIEMSVSGGGRLFFFTLGRIDVLPVEPNRWLVLDLTPTEDDPMPYQDSDGNFLSPNIDDVYGEPDPEDPQVNPADYIDNVKCTISLDVMFNKNATRQPLVIEVRIPGPYGGWAPSGWTLRSVEDLYIVQDPVDKNVRTLTTVNPTGDDDADEFLLRHDGVTVGRYRIPLSWTMRLVDAP